MEPTATCAWCGKVIHLADGYSTVQGKLYHTRCVEEKLRDEGRWQRQAPELRLEAQDYDTL